MLNESMIFPVISVYCTVRLQKSQLHCAALLLHKKEYLSFLVVTMSVCKVFIF